MGERLKPIVSDLIGPYQALKTQIATYHLFVDYKAAFDIPIRGKLYEAISEFGIPAKLIRLCRITPTNTKSSVKVGKYFLEPFDTMRGFRQGDTRSCDLFNILMDIIIRKAAVNMNKNHQQQKVHAAHAC